MKTLLSVIGARPQFIKAAPVSRALRAHDGFRDIVVHTGQHFDRDMSDVFFEELGLSKPDHHLGIHGGGHGEMTGRMIVALEELALTVKPDAFIIYGDTNSTLAAAIVAAKLYIPIAHIEAGLRSFKQMPEEINRVIADRVSRWRLCPTKLAVANLAAEGIRDGVHNVGDVMYDTALLMRDRANAQSKIIATLGLKPDEFALATIHRAENTDSPQALAEAVAYLGEAARERPVILPLHPRTRQAAARFAIDLSGLRIVDPVGYLDMTALISNCHRVLTDSGGVQKEAYFHRKPCVTMRDATEWTETVETGWNRLWKSPDYLPRRENNAYGDGNAAKKIVNIIVAQT